MRLGFAKTDVTPRVGVELCGFGPFINRHSIGVRDRLWSRAMAVEMGEKRAVVISNDLVMLELATVTRIRELIGAQTGLPPEAIMVHCTHTHSGPNTSSMLNGWGVLDHPYMEVLPQKIAAAAVQALANLQEATLSYAEVPCEGIGLNREYDKDAPALEDVLRDDWRPEKPELTDTTCHVLVAHAALGVVRASSPPGAGETPALPEEAGETPTPRGGGILGFAAYFGCHPVVCCATTRYIHGDYAGVAMNALEREHPGSVGLFLQGAQGDVNSCVVHKPEQEALLALDVIAGRFARSVRDGLRQAEPLAVDDMAYVLQEATFTRRALTAEDIAGRLHEQEEILQRAGASDEDGAVRMATVFALAYRKLLAAMSGGAGCQSALSPSTQLSGLRLGPLVLLGAPFETFQAIKNDVRQQAQSPLTLVMGITNDSLGYAPDRACAERGGYAADMVPLMLSSLPFARVHDELVEGLLAVEAKLREA
jgi:hypothetical protein